MKEIYYYPENFFNRELSWLEFNRRVLEEAKDENNPLIERFKFLSIVSSNLDEFFMVRVASVYDNCEAGVTKRDISGRTPQEQMRDILSTTRKMIDNQYKYYFELKSILSEKQINFVKYNELSTNNKEYIDKYYNNEIYPVLTPMVVDKARPFPLVLDKTLNIALLLEDKHDANKVFATIQVPSVLSRMISVPCDNCTKYILLEDIIKAKLGELFSSHKVLHSYCYRITKNASMNVDEEEAEDLLETIEQSLKQRKWGDVIRLEIENGAPQDIIDRLMEELEISTDYVLDIDGPIDLTFLSKLGSIKGYEELKYKPIKVNHIKELATKNIFDVVKERDILLHHPFQSFDPIVDMIKSAAEDPNVLAIKQTLYRVSGNSPIVEALSKAAEKGKQVTVLVELKARFDEENNINWAKKLEKSGCHVIYGVIGLKTHCKVLLIVRKEKSCIKRYVHFGTGNYNDVTANFYTDIGIITSDEQYGEDASILFNMLSGYSSPKNMKKMSIAPVDFRDKFEYMIRREAEFARQGKKAKIIAKMNSLFDTSIITELYDASNAGVEIELIVRGICALKPGVKGLSENITVKSVVGRFLEHSRIYYFYNDGNEEVYISSGDWMYRNLSKRVETMGIVENNEIKEKIKEILDVYLKDNTKSRILNSDGTYQKYQRDGKQVDAQVVLIDTMKDRTPKREVDNIFVTIKK